MFTKILYAIDIINKSPKNSRIYLRFSMRQKKDREAYLHLPFSIGSIPIPVWNQYRESQRTIPPTFKEFAFRLINGVVRVREFAYDEYGY